MGQCLERFAIHASIVSGRQPRTRPIMASGSGRRPGTWLYAFTVLRDRPVLSATSATDRYFCTVPTVNTRTGTPAWVSRPVRFSAMLRRMAARRSPWLDDRAALLVRLLDEEHQLTITHDVAREDISDHLDLVAEMMRIGRKAAKVYVTDDVITQMADRIAQAVREHTSPDGRPPLRVVE